MTDSSGITNYLCKSTQEKDLGIIITNTASVTTQCLKAAASANRKLSLLKNTFMSRDIFIWSELYLTYIRPLLQFALPVWCPFLKKDIQIIENVQRKATKICN